MSKIAFNVSARAARLIGRENLATPDGAIIELVKNAYDADAEACILYFDNLFSPFPTKLSEEEYILFSNEFKDLHKFYENINLFDNSFEFKNDKSLNYDELRKFFLSKCTIYIIDNGKGMDIESIRNYWMTIGTDNKEINFLSDDGRVKTGAKGIGRFALDKLGEICEIYTLPKNKLDGHKLNVNWNDFELLGAKINEVTADVEEIHKLNLKEYLNNNIFNKNLIKYLEEINLDNGTIIKISKIRDIWDNKIISKLFSNLEILNPPKEQTVFSISLYTSLEPEEYGTIISTGFSDYDYKLHAEFYNNDDKNIKITLERNELDLDLIDQELFNIDTMKDPPFDYHTLVNKQFSYNKSLYELLKGIRDSDINKELDKIGDFNFTFYFLKNSISKDDRIRYPYKNFMPKKRKEWLNKFGGIKIFRDGFRVRPYGENGSDWLRLGERQAQSPGGAGQRIGGYRIRPNQVSGSINISRVENRYFQDKSGREGIIENTTFDILKEIIISLIAEFERDRNLIMYSLDQLYVKKNIEEDVKRKAKEIADKKSNASNKSEIDKSSEELKEENETLAKGFKAQEKELEEKDLELRISRSLSTTGLMVASFAHELKQIKLHLKPRTKDLEEIIDSIIDKVKIQQLPNFQNPYKMIENIKRQDERLYHWLSLSLSTLTKSNQEKSSIDIDSYFNEFKQNWSTSLLYRNIELVIPKQKIECSIVGYHIDLDSIFNNLISNSFDAFKNSSKKGNRKIDISYNIEDTFINIQFQDNGPGLSKDLKTPYEIFEPFVTTKIDERGNKYGTGLGLWIVKTIVDEYKGEIKITPKTEGFSIIIKLPIKYPI